MARMGTEFKVGLFTLVGLAAIACAVFFVSPELFDRKEKKFYFTNLKDASGILVNTHVKTNGVNIGRVSDIALDDNNTRVQLELLKEVKIPQGSEVVVRTVGFLGDRYIDVVRPDGGGEPIAANSMIPPAKSSGDIAEVVGKIGGIADDLKKVTSNLAKVLGDEQGEKRMANIAENIEKLTESAKVMLAENRDNTRDLIKNFRDVSASLKDITNEQNRIKIDRIIDTFDKSMNDVKATAESARLISQKIEKGEGTIGKLINDDKTVEEIQGALRDIREVLNPVTKLQIAVDTHLENRRDESTQTYFNLRLTTRPDSFYILGFTNLPDRVRDTSTQTLDGDPTGDNTVKIRERIKDDRQLRFNLQIGKRWKWLAARIGLFESTGGIAADTYFWKDRFRLSLEAFNFTSKDSDERRQTHLKAYASVLFFDHLIAMAGIDDPTRYKVGTRTVDKKLNYFIGAGLTFNDQDLRSMFGLAAIAAAGN